MFSGAELEQVVISGLFRRFFSLDHWILRTWLRSVIVPLAYTMDDQLKDLSGMGSSAGSSCDRRSARVDFFPDWEDTGSK